MFDTMTLTKAGGALCGSLLVLLLGNWAADALYYVGPKGAHGEGDQQAYVIDTGPADGATAAAAPAEAGPDFATLMASADAAAGEKVFAKCKACHKLDGANATGPHLNGVVNRAVGGVADFNYWDAMKNHGGTWTPDLLNTYLTDPKKDIPGNKMSFAGLPKAQDRANLIAFLETQGG